MAIVSPTSGSSTITGWKRRSSAASFSMCLRYSSSVVAPTARSSPRASMGFRRFAASTAPSAAPAPTIVCSSSMNRTICPSEAWISFSTAFSRSSNSPRYFEPANSAPMSSAITRRSRRLSGMSPATIRCARPSTIAVFPTPGSPIRTGLFLVRRDRTWITRRTSSSRPMTGSSLPLLGLGGQISPVLLERLHRVLRGRRGDPVRAADLGDPLGQRAAVGKQVRQARGLVREGEQEVFGRDVLVAQRGHLLLGTLEGANEGLRGPDLGLRFAADRGQAGDRRERALADRAQIRVELLEHRHHEAVLLVQQREEEVRRADLRVSILGGKPLRAGHGLLGLDREAIRLHRYLRLDRLTGILIASPPTTGTIPSAS